ncbi:hypothetical protein XELAEV_18012920mg [Xenopus laevis]|uniref:Uncharacterized protein n=1 Tax=Xenopus laevis TaxID=8355 RepID=A0A974DPW0_XENLA|nr:hypothetical protein XELAEV_18012920mg [Xenopus laevis]
MVTHPPKVIGSCRGRGGKRKKNQCRAWNSLSWEWDCALPGVCPSRSHRRWKKCSGRPEYSLEFGPDAQSLAPMLGVVGMTNRCLVAVRMASYTAWILILEPVFRV